MKDNADEAVATTPSIEHVLVVKRTETEVPWTEGRDVWWHDIVDRPVRGPRGPRRSTPRTRCSSSTPRAPRGSRRASCTPPAATSPRRVHPPRRLRPQARRDVYWCTADIGWVTGHSYIVYGPLANRATSVMYEGTPNTPHQGRHWGDHPEVRRHDLLHRAHADPHVHEVGQGDPGRSTTCRRCGCSAASASRSTPRPGCGTGRTSAATTARSSTPGGRPRPAPS